MIELEREIKSYLHICNEQKRLSIHTIKAYSIDLEQFKQFAGNAEDISKDIITGYIANLHKKYMPKSVKRKLASIKAFYKYMETEEIFVKNPTRKVNTKFREPIVLPRVIPLKIVNSILSTAYSKLDVVNTDYLYRMALRNIAIIELLFSTGLRVSELCSLNSDCIDLISGDILVMGKGAKERVMQIGNSEVLTALNKYKNANAIYIEQSEAFFVNRLNSRLSEQSVRALVKKLSLEANVMMHITPHMYRHTFASSLLEEDVDIRYIQNMLGHSSIRTTQIYTSVVAEKQRQILTFKHPRNKFTHIL